MKSVSLPFDSSCQAYCLSISRAKFHAEKRGVVVTYIFFLAKKGICQTNHPSFKFKTCSKFTGGKISESIFNFVTSSNKTRKNLLSTFFIQIRPATNINSDFANLRMGQIEKNLLRLHHLYIHLKDE